MCRFVVLIASLGTISFATPSAVQPSDDERQLLTIQQQLARAWMTKDRAFIEGVLAPEWSVTQADGTMMTRATALGAFFNAVTIDSADVDDVTVTLFGDTAVVRGRTVARGKLNGSPISARIRFTDVFLKRRGRWQAVASHASPLAENPFVGTWTMNMSKSKLDPTFQFKGATLEIAVAGDTITMASELVDAAGQTRRVAETFRTDGVETPGTLNPGVVLMSRWVGPTVLASVAKKDGQVIALVTYEVASDGKTLTSRSSGIMTEQVSVFDRK
jgi:ketosteroid isomerase-like protein